jgi:hypothetical protein
MMTLHLPLFTADSSIPPSRHDARGSKVVAEGVTALCIFFSNSIFLAHSVDAFCAAR